MSRAATNAVPGAAAERTLTQWALDTAHQHAAHLAATEDNDDNGENGWER